MFNIGCSAFKFTNETTTTGNTRMISCMIHTHSSLTKPGISNKTWSSMDKILHHFLDDLSCSLQGAVWLRDVTVPYFVQENLSIHGAGQIFDR